MPGTGGKTLGFWSNKNGQALINSSDVDALNALNLYKPTGWEYPPFTDKTQIKSYLLSATAVNMSWMLSAQLIATELNVRHGFLRRVNHRLRWAFNLRAQRLHKHQRDHGKR
jgi:hypothetical protein